MFERLIIEFDRGLRTILAPARTSRPSPAETLPETALEPNERARSAALMRVNHSGEVSAQALYQGQAAVARSAETRSTLRAASIEEEDHLAWTERRIAELHGRKSALNPLWYAGSFAIGALAGAFGDKPSYSFLAETERQVTQHLDEHLARVPANDAKSRAILFEMREDEAKHATTANTKGAMPLPAPIVFAMRMASKVMTRTSYWL
ncbi:MAG: 2-polyprenyl-3-methyl-6-methoxy-1,4-benzoquinone monooxygenase [Burkholderiales bacterium]